MNGAEWVLATRDEGEAGLNGLREGQQGAKDVHIQKGLYTYCTDQRSRHMGAVAVMFKCRTTCCLCLIAVQHPSRMTGCTPQSRRDIHTLGCKGP